MYCPSAKLVGSHQTLGRAQMGLGEVKLGLRSFQIALHLNPEDKELREDDLQWAFHTLNEKEKRDGNTKDTRLNYYYVTARLD